MSMETVVWVSLVLLAETQLRWWRERLWLDHFCCFQQHLRLLSLCPASRAPSPFSLPSSPCCTSGNRPKIGRMFQISGALKAMFLFEAGLFFQPFPVFCWSVWRRFSPAKCTSGISLILSVGRGESRTCHPFSFQNSKMKRLPTELLHPWTRNDTSWMGFEVPPVCPQLSRASWSSWLQTTGWEFLKHLPPPWGISLRKNC